MPRTAPRIAVIGLGYVGLPVAVAFAEAHAGTVGFDIDATKVDVLRRGRDPNGEVDSERLQQSGLRVSTDPSILTNANTYVVTVPTPVDADKRPDLRPLMSACETIGPHLRPGITGWAQINGRNAVSWEERLAMGGWYVDNRTLWLDLRILVTTLWKTARREGIAAEGEATVPEFTGSDAIRTKDGRPA